RIGPWSRGSRTSRPHIREDELSESVSPLTLQQRGQLFEPSLARDIRRRFSVARLSLRIGTSTEQQPGSFDVTSPRGAVQWHVVQLLRGVRIGAMIEQQLHDLA